jgi:hypothetical protein
LIYWYKSTNSDPAGGQDEHVKETYKRTIHAIEQVLYIYICNWGGT